MSETTSAQVFRGRVVIPEGVLDDGVVVVEGRTIAWVGGVGAAAATRWADLVARAEPAVPGAHLLPGLVDLHCHGGGGASFPDATEIAEVRVAAAEHLVHGTTSLVASLVTADRATLLERTALLADAVQQGVLAAIHLEGPFLSAARCGAQDPSAMQLGDVGLVREVAAAARGAFATMTVAPESIDVSGPGGVIEVLAEVGAVPSFGHTDASAETTEAAIAEAVAALSRPGARSARPTATHLFNGMRPVHHRDPGPVAACLAAAARDQLVVELVADGVHLAPATVRTVFDLVGPDVVLVTDAMAAAGMSDGEYDLGPARVRVTKGVARLVAGDTIAGGTAHLLDVVRHTVEVGVDLVSAVRAASLTPAGVLGRTDLGALEAGRRADLVVTDPELRPVLVVRRGDRVTG